MLNNYFNINLPYGISRNDKGKWMSFNRAYLPVGFNSNDLNLSPGENYLKDAVYTKYVGLTEEALKELACNEFAIQRDNSGLIVEILFYEGDPNLMSQIDRAEFFNKYFEKINKLSKLKKAKY
ncbi:MAG: hypothetical protein NTZ33_11430 [Bacteroidetes bacterium]|nr:hypothetical protein [Bacteroidota bacterium]